MRIINPPGYVGSVLRSLTGRGFAAFLVGGCVRDAVMGREVSDWDVATSANPAEVADMFPRTFLTGEKYGTVTVLARGGAVEVTTFRADGEYSDGRRPESVEFVSSIELDLSRRDFTVNAMAVSPEGELIDPYGGLGDIKGRIIRCVGEPDLRFGEDALRMFRAYRLRAQLGFTIEPETVRAVYANAGRASAVSAERVRVEVEKTLMSDMPETAGEMIEAGLLDRYLAGRVAFSAQQGRSPGGLDKIAGLPKEPVMRWCGFCMALLAGRHITSVPEFLRGMRLDAKTARTCSCALSIPVIPADRAGVKRLLAKYGEDAVRCAAAVRHMTQGESSAVICYAGDVDADSEAAAPSPCVTSLSKVEEIITGGECYSPGKLAVKGSDLIAQGHLPGPGLGATLGELLDHVIGNPEDNTREILLQIAERKKTNG